MGTECAYLPITAILQDDARALLGDKLKVINPTTGQTGSTDVGLKGFSSNKPTGDPRELAVDVVLLDEVAVQIPGLDGVELVFVADAWTTCPLTEIHATAEINPFTSFSFTFEPVLRFSGDLLKPVRQKSGTVSADTPAEWEDDPTRPHAEITIEDTSGVTITVDAEGKVKLTPEVFALSLAPCMIGDTGIVLEVDELVLYLGGKPSGAEPTEEPDGWKGVYLKTAKLYLPELHDASGAFASFDVDQLRVGQGGISGTLLSTVPASLDLGGLSINLREVLVEFKQNALVECKVRFGVDLDIVVDLPELGLVLGYTQDGGLTFGLDPDDANFTPLLATTSTSMRLAGTALAPTASTELELPGLLKLTITSITPRFSPRLELELAGTIQPLAGSAQGLDWPLFEVEQLVLSRDGVQFTGGWVNVPEQFRFDLHGFSAELNKLGFGEEVDGDDVYGWLGFSGAIQLSSGIALGAEFEKLRILWPKMIGGAPATSFNLGDIRITLDELAVDLTIPDVLSFTGRVSFIDDGVQRGFRGGISLTLYPAKLTVDAELLCVRVDDGSGSKFNAFYIYVNANFPVGIPLAATGVALYGVAGLYGQNVVPDKLPQEQWYENWYKAGTNRLSDTREPAIYGDTGDDPGAVASTKWQPEKGSMAFGAGISFGTATDDGHAVNGKLLLLVIIPGPIIMLEGRANLLKDRAKLTPESEATFEALAILDGRAGQFLLNVSAQYVKPDTDSDDPGRILDIRASAEAFFDFHRADNWHLYIGQDDPTAKRIRAEVLRLFEANAYFMLTPRSLRFGFWVGYDRSWTFGPAKVALSAWIALDVGLSWKPVQLFGQLQMHGGIEISAFGFGLGITVDALLAGQTPAPFHVLAALTVSIDLPWPLKDIEAKVRLEWGKEDKVPPAALPLAAFAMEHFKATEKWRLDQMPRYDTAALPGMLPAGAGASPYSPADEWALIDAQYADEGDPGAIGAPVVPLDAHPALTFARPVFDDIGFGGRRAGALERVGKTAFEHHLSEVRLALGAESGGTWTWTSLAVRSALNPSGNLNVDALRGSWQLVDGGGDALPNAKLVLGALSDSAWTREQAGPMCWTGLVDQLPELPCPPLVRPVERCLDWADDAIGTDYKSARVKDGVVVGPCSPEGGAVPITATVVYRPLAVFALEQALHQQGAPGQTVALCFAIPGGATSFALALDVEDSMAEIFGYENGVLRFEAVVQEPGPQTVTYPGPHAIDRIEVVSSFFTSQGAVNLYRLCFMPGTRTDRDLWHDSLDDFQVLWQAGGQPLLRPGQTYRLTAVTRIRRNGGWTPVEQHAYFVGGPPPGVTPLPGDSATISGEHEHYPTHGQLIDLAPYVAGTVPAAEARPAYRAYDVTAQFNEPYVRSLYAVAQKALAVDIVDAVGEPVVAAHQDVEDRSAMTLGRTEVEWLVLQDRAQKADCGIDLDWSLVPRDEQLRASDPKLLLRPETLHVARVIADGTVPIGGDGLRNPVFAWRFITSRFAHFRHHVGSFGDRLWDESAIRGTALLGPGQLASLELIVFETTTPPASPSRFDRLAHLFGFGSQPAAGAPGRWLRQPPRGLELTLLRDGAERYGLLLESPEPLDPARVHLGTAAGKAQYRGGFAPVLARLAGDVKLLDVAGGGDLANEAVDVLLLAATDLSDWKIESAAAAPSALYAPHFTFASAPAYPEGTVVRVHTGVAPTVPDPDETTVHVYAGHGSAQLGAVTRRLRLVDASANTVHSRLFVRTYAVERDMVAVWNADHTAAFLFFPTSGTSLGSLGDGAWRLPLAFARAVPGAATFTHLGQITPEEASVAWVLGAESSHTGGGDFDLDGVIGLDDLAAAVERWRKPAAGADAVFDLDADGRIDALDIQRVAANVGKEL